MQIKPWVWNLGNKDWYFQFHSAWLDRGSPGSLQTVWLESRLWVQHTMEWLKRIPQSQTQRVSRGDQLGNEPNLDSLHEVSPLVEGLLCSSQQDPERDGKKKLTCTNNRNNNRANKNVENSYLNSYFSPAIHRKILSCCWIIFFVLLLYIIQSQVKSTNNNDQK